MTRKEREEWLKNIYAEAVKSGHIWPDYAACEIALESNWGQSELFKQANNGFGRKQSIMNPVYETITLPTKEFKDGGWITVNTEWVKYPSIADCFLDRINLLKKLASTYTNYKLALEATTGEDFILYVSKTWATDPNRGLKVIAIHSNYRDCFKDPPKIEETKEQQMTQEEYKSWLDRILNRKKK